MTQLICMKTKSMYRMTEINVYKDKIDIQNDEIDIYEAKFIFIQKDDTYTI